MKNSFHSLDSSFAANAPAAPLVNVPELMIRVDHDRELFRELLTVFKEEFPRHFAALRAAVRARELRKVVDQSHALKGMLANLAATGAAACAGDLEKLAHAENTAALRRAFCALEIAVDGLLPHLEILVEEAPFENTHRG